MGKPTICIGENKGTDQLRSNYEADQRLCFRYTDRTILLLNRSLKLLTIFCGCTGGFVSELVGNPNCWFSHAQAHLSRLLVLIIFLVDLSDDQGGQWIGSQTIFKIHSLHLH